MTELLCPVCNQPMSNTEVNNFMYGCRRKRVWNSELSMYLDIVDAVVYLSPEGQIIRKIIEVGSYSFVICYEEGNLSTEIRQLKCNSNNINKNRIFESVVILKISATLDCQWNNKKSVYDKVKACLVFS